MRLLLVAMPFMACLGLETVTTRGERLTRVGQTPTSVGVGTGEPGDDCAHLEGHGETDGVRQHTNGGCLNRRTAEPDLAELGFRRGSDSSAICSPCCLPHPHHVTFTNTRVTVK